MLTVNLNHEYWRPKLAEAIGEREEAMPAETVEGFIREVMVEYTARTAADYNTTNFTPRGVGIVHGGFIEEKRAFHNAYDAVIDRWKADSPE